MRLFNSADGYGWLTKVLHWLIALLFAFQLAAGLVMTRMPPTGTAGGMTQADWYNWHKSIGLVALVIALARLLNRRIGELPPWAPTLSEGEQRFIIRAEEVMYAAMLLMPASGFIYVMAGGYGVHLFGLWHLPNPIGVRPWLAGVAKWTHILAGWALYLTVFAHIGLVLRHQLVLKDGLLWRMLPSRNR
jgi:cytochrome b561